MLVGITGHRTFADPAVWAWVRQEMDSVLGSVARPLVGLSALAPGADQLFGRAVLEQGGTLEVVLPFADYADRLEDGDDRVRFDALLKQAAQVTVLAGGKTDELAYLAMGQHLVAAVDLLIAVWNGRPAAGVGGTADVVAYAVQRGCCVVHLNPVSRRVSRFPDRRGTTT